MWAVSRQAHICFFINWILTSQPSTLNPQPSTSTLNPQPSTLNLNPQPSTLNPQPSTLNPTAVEQILLACMLGFSLLLSCSKFAAFGFSASALLITNVIHAWAPSTVAIASVIIEGHRYAYCGVLAVIHAWIASIRLLLRLFVFAATAVRSLPAQIYWDIATGVPHS